MSASIQQQVIISGVGGQGVLFVTRLLAEAAINKGLPVFTSETHGMAQRGGTVLSHLKVGDFASPLIRPFQADILVLLKPENLKQHESFLKPDGWVVSNGIGNLENGSSIAVETVDADALAQKIGNPKAVNLIVLGFALATAEKAAADDQLFCSAEDIKDILKNRFGENEKMLNASIEALEAGYKA
jgi:indolepyruvate ferredoxin oxidoreductase beta subunit